MDDKEIVEKCEAEVEHNEAMDATSRVIEAKIDIECKEAQDDMDAQEAGTVSDVHNVR